MVPYLDGLVYTVLCAYIGPVLTSVANQRKNTVARGPPLECPSNKIACLCNQKKSMAHTTSSRIELRNIITELVSSLVSQFTTGTYHSALKHAMSTVGSSAHRVTFRKIPFHMTQSQINWNRDIRDE